MGIEPINDQVLVRCAEADSVSTGGIILPKSAREQIYQGTVVAVGEGKVVADGTRKKTTVNVGDDVIYNAYAGTDIEVGGVNHLMVRDEDIMAVLE